MNGSGIAILNIDEAPIIIKAFSDKQIFGMQEDIMNLILSHYQKALKGNFIKVISSTELLGNPLKFYNKIKTGMSDFVEKPR
jgi:vacuolar protein sorting-associated protein 13A/C